MVSKKAKVTGLLIVVIFACLAVWWMGRLANSNNHSNVTTPANTSDTTPPQVALNPTIDVSIARSGSFTVGVSATDNKDVSRVEYRIDGKFSSVSYSSPFSVTLDISNLSVGEHVLTITAFDTSGNASNPQKYTFKVAASAGTTNENSPQATDTTTQTPPVVYKSTPTDSAVVIQPGVVVTPPPTLDGIAPTTPSNLVAAQSAEHDVTLTWAAASDNVGVAGYRLWRDGVQIADVSSLSFVDSSALPGKTHSYKIQSYDAAGNVSAYSQSISITLADITIFSSSDTPPTIATADNAGIELGLRIRPSVSGYITGVRFYKNTGNTGTHIGNLWDMAGINMGTVTFTDETATGWQIAKFSTPVAVTGGTDYLVSYYAPNGNYTATGDFFNQSFFSSQYLVVPSPADSGTTGVYGYSASSAFPTNNFNNANYWVDATFSPSSVVSAPSSFAACPAYPAFPDASCTGVAPGSTLMPYQGTLSVTRDNTTLYNLDVTGTIIIRANNVTIINSKIHGSVPGIQTLTGNVTVRNSEFYNIDNAAVMFNDWKGYNLNIHDMLGDGVKLGNNVALEDSYIHDFTPGTGSHSDGGQMQNGESNILVRHNTIDALYGNSALFFAPDLGPSGVGPIVIDKNLLGGGGYTLAIVDGNNGQYHQSGYTITNNHFLRDFNYGPLHINEPLANFDAWMGNVWHDTGEIISNTAL